MTPECAWSWVLCLTDASHLQEDLQEPLLANTWIFVLSAKIYCFPDQDVASFESYRVSAGLQDSFCTSIEPNIECNRFRPHAALCERSKGLHALGMYGSTESNHVQLHFV